MPLAPERGCESVLGLGGPHGTFRMGRGLGWACVVVATRTTMTGPRLGLSMVLLGWANDAKRR